MYCPVCFNETLKLGSTGIVKMTFNQKSLSTSQFFYDFKKDSLIEIQEKIKKVIENYFQFYSQLKNSPPIKEFEITSNSFVCSKSCKMPLNYRHSVKDELILNKDINKILKTLGQIYQIDIQSEM